MSGRVKHRKRGPIDYRRTRRREPPRPTIELDVELLAELRTPREGSRLPATGRCHTCDRAVSGERRYCGPCAAKRDSV